LRRDTDVVKTPPEATPAGSARANFRRHLQGYELGLLTLAIVSSCALLALPRASVPSTLPLPRVDRSEARRNAVSDHELAALAASEPLPFEVRAVGESVRHFGHAVTHGTDTEHDRSDLRERSKLVLDKGQTALLLRLRAVQTELFLSALEQFEHTGKPSTDLDELGADFVVRARASGWLDARGRCIADEATRRVLYHMHWADLIDRRTAFPFAPTLEEWRLYYRFLLEHPTSAAANDPDVIDRERLRVVNALERRDPDYPGSFAKGVLLYRMNDRQAAATAFRVQLAQHESGPYALLARNYLIESLQGVSAE